MDQQKDKRRRKVTAGFYSSKEWHKVRGRVLRRDGYRCVNCGASVRGKRQARIDHILPRKERPDLALDPANLRTLCVVCDNARHHWDRALKKDEPDEVPLSGLPPGWE